MVKTEIKTEIKTIEDVQKVLQRIPYLNNGGCGIAALAVGRWLKKSDLHASTMYLFGQDSSVTFKQNNEAILNTENKPSSAAHIGVLIYDHNHGKQMVIDSNGVFDITRYTYANITNEKFLVKSINECCEWNQMFDRTTNVERIAMELGIDLSDIDLRTKNQYLDPDTKFLSYKEKTESEEVDELLLAKRVAEAEMLSFWPILM